MIAVITMSVPKLPGLCKRNATTAARVAQAYVLDTNLRLSGICRLEGSLLRKRVQAFYLRNRPSEVSRCVKWQLTHFSSCRPVKKERPRSFVRGATYDPGVVTEPKGVRAPGLNTLGKKVSATYHKDGERHF